MGPIGIYREKNSFSISKDDDDDEDAEDGGNNKRGEAVMGLSTDFAHYYLLKPAPIYESFINAVREKSHLVMLIIHFLSGYPDAEYAELLNHLRMSTPPSGVAPFTEDAVFVHAEFILRNLRSLHSG